MRKIAWGIVGLLSSRKGALCLLILATSTVGLLLSKLDGVSYAAIVATISTIYQFVQHRTDIAAMGAGK